MFFATGAVAVLVEHKTGLASINFNKKASSRSLGVNRFPSQFVTHSIHDSKIDLFVYETAKPKLFFIAS